MVFKEEIEVLRYLTSLELEILYVLASGWSYRQIATYLGMSKWVIRSIIHNMYTVLHVENAAQAVVAASKLGYLRGSIDEFSPKV